MLGVAVIIGLLVFLPDDHQNADFVFTEKLNLVGFGDGATAGLPSGSWSCRRGSC